MQHMKIHDLTDMWWIKEVLHVVPGLEPALTLWWRNLVFTASLVLVIVSALLGVLSFVVLQFIGVVVCILYFVVGVLGIVGAYKYDRRSIRLYYSALVMSVVVNYVAFIFGIYIYVIAMGWLCPLLQSRHEYPAFLSCRLQDFIVVTISVVTVFLSSLGLVSCAWCGRKLDFAIGPRGSGGLAGV